MRAHFWPLLILSLWLAIVYGRVSTVYFCGFDDFADVHRAQFEDSKDPWGILTKTHFGTSKYRPVQRALTYFTWKLGGGSPIAFRIRNLAFHLALAFSLYGIAWLLFSQRCAAFGAAAFFALHPLANQSVVAAIWAVTAAYAFLFASFFLFLLSLHYREWEKRSLIASLAIFAFGIFTYEPVVVLFAWMGIYIWIWRRRGGSLSRNILWIWGTGCSLNLIIFVAIRFAFVTQKSQITPPLVLAKNLVLYAGALLSPYDLVAGHFLFGTPLPSQIRFTPWFFAVAGFGLLAMLAALFRLISSPKMRARWLNLPGWELGMCAAMMAALLGPYLVFTDHASETYLYSPVAIFGLLVSVVLSRLLPIRIFVLVLIPILLMFSVATWVRSERVVACGNCAEAIVTNLPWAQWRTGAWSIRLATPANSPPLIRFGIYGYHGLATIDPREPYTPSAEWAVRMQANNDRIRVRVVDPQDLSCSQPDLGFWVFDSGQVKDVCAP